VEKAHYPVILLCAVLKVARSSYYAWIAGEEAREKKRRADAALAHESTVLHVASRHIHGVPRVHAELRRLGHAVNRWGCPRSRGSVERVMRERGIAGHSHRTGRRCLTKADRMAAPAPDLLGRDITAARPGARAVGDITYVPTTEGWLYLATWMDLATREIIGYSMADHHRADLVVDALDMAAGPGRLHPGCIIHTDRGSEYTSARFRTRIGELGLRQSMGRTGGCYDNAAAESFFAVLKEEIGTRIWADRVAARADIFTFIETFYNRRRLRKHVDRGYLTPHETRRRYEQTGPEHALAA